MQTIEVITQAEVEHLNAVLHPLAAEDPTAPSLKSQPTGDIDQASATRRRLSNKIVRNGKFLKVQTDPDPSASFRGIPSRETLKDIISRLGISILTLSTSPASRERKTFVNDLWEAIEEDFRCMSNEERETRLRELGYVHYTNRRNRVDQFHDDDDEREDVDHDDEAYARKPTQGGESLEQLADSRPRLRLFKDDRRHGRQLSTDKGKEELRYITQAEEAKLLESEEVSSQDTGISVEVTGTDSTSADTSVVSLALDAASKDVIAPENNNHNRRAPDLSLSSPTRAIHSGIRENDPEPAIFFGPMTLEEHRRRKENARKHVNAKKKKKKGRIPKSEDPSVSIPTCAPLPITPDSNRPWMPALPENCLRLHSPTFISTHEFLFSATISPEAISNAFLAGHSKTSSPC